MLKYLNFGFASKGHKPEQISQNFIDTCYLQECESKPVPNRILTSSLK